MAFHEEQFPTTISYGSRGGPGHKTTILELDSGVEQRFAGWGGAKRRYNARWGIKTLDNLVTVQAFVIARDGALHGFRFKDHLDYHTAATHTGTVAKTDVTIGTGDGTTTQFQLVKRYTSGPTTKVRNITKPVASTTLAEVNGVTKTDGADFTIDTTTGIMTFSVAPTAGHVIKAGFQFDVPVHFDQAVDEVLSCSIDAFDTGDIPDIGIVEELATVVQAEDFYYGGGSVQSFGASIQVTPLMGKVISLAATTTGLTVYLPAPSNFADGGVHLYLWNAGSNAITIKSGSTTVVSSGNFPASTKIALCILTISGVKTWVPF